MVPIMKWMQTFIFKFILLAIFTLAVIVYYVLNNIKKENIVVDNKIKKLKNSIKKINKKEYSPSEFIRVLEDIDKYAKRKKVDININKARSNEIVLSLSGKLKSLLDIISFSEQNSLNIYIDSFLFKYSKDKKRSIAIVKLKLSNTVIKDKIDVEDLKKKLSKIVNVFIKYDNNDKPKLYAVIGKHVLINSKWLELNDKFNKYKVVEITKDYVVLDDGVNSKTLKLFKYE